MPEAAIRVQTGNPANRAIEVRVRGGDNATVFQLSERVAEIIRATPGAADTWSSQAPGSPEARLVPDRLRGPDSGVTADVAASVLRTTLEGSVASKFRVPGEREIDVRFMGDPRADRRSARAERRASQRHVER